MSFKNGKAKVKTELLFNSTEEGTEDTFVFPAVSKAELVDAIVTTYEYGKVLHLETPLGHGVSFALYKFEDGGLYFMAEPGLSPTANAAIFDKDGDGIYEGFYVERDDYQTFFYRIYEEFEFGAESYVGVDGVIELPEIPDDPEEFVKQYIELCCIRNKERNSDLTPIPLYSIDSNGREESLEKRLEKMADFPFDDRSVWSYGFVFHTNMQFSNNYIKFTTDVQGSAAQVVAQAVGDDHAGFVDYDDYANDKAAVYELEKRGGQWVITDQHPLFGMSGALATSSQEGLYDPIFLPTQNTAVDGTLEVIADEPMGESVRIVTEVLEHEEDYIACHIYLEDCSMTLDGLLLDWYVIEQAGELYMTTYDVFLELPEEELYENMYYAGGIYDYEDEKKGQPGFHESNYFVNGVSSCLFKEDSEDPVYSESNCWIEGEGFGGYGYSEKYADGFSVYVNLDVVKIH